MESATTARQAVCSILAQCGRQVNDILADDDRQRLKIFICRLAGSKDCEAKKRRTRIFVDVVMRGLLEMDGLSPRERMSIRLGLASARFWIWLGPLAQPAARASEIFEKHYTRAQDPQRARFVDLICKAFDEALNAGKQGEIDPVQAAGAMTAYERMTGIRSDLRGILIRERHASRKVEGVCRNVACFPGRLTGIGVRQHENERLDIAQHLRFEPRAFGRKFNL